jgi:multidrug efflux system outer membrane protein
MRAREVKALVAWLLAATATACTVGPAFRRPAVDLPPTFRGAPSDDAVHATAFGDQAWWDVFEDDRLRELIDSALRQNLDLRIAAARIVEAQAQLGVTRADQFPTVDGHAEASRSRAARSVVPFALDPYERSDLQLTVTAAWELDFWGKYRRATDAARAALVETEWGRRAVATDLVTQVAGAYFQLQSLDVGRLGRARRLSPGASVPRTAGAARSLRDRCAAARGNPLSRRRVELSRSLDSETRALSAQLGLAQSELNERLALTQIYRALGGGW